MNSPIYVGLTKLELSKLFMYKFHYNHIKTSYQDPPLYRYRLSDILDSNHEHEYIWRHEEKYLGWFFRLSEKSCYIRNWIRKLLGKFKDELCGQSAFEFVRDIHENWLKLSYSRRLQKLHVAEKIKVIRFKQNFYKKDIICIQYNKNKIFIPVRW